MSNYEALSKLKLQNPSLSLKQLIKLSLQTVKPAPKPKKAKAAKQRKSSKTVYTISEFTGPLKAHSVYVYSDGTIVNTLVKGKGRAAVKLPNGAILTEIKRYLTEKKVKVPKNIETLTSKLDILTENLVGPKQTTLTYADGTLVIAGRGKYTNILNGSQLVLITKYTPGSTKFTGDIERLEVISDEAYSEFHYADGNIISNQGIEKSSRPFFVVNGSNLIKIIKHVKAKNLSKEEKKIAKVARKEKNKVSNFKNLSHATLTDLVVGTTYKYLDIWNQTLINVTVVAISLAGKITGSYVYEGKTDTGNVKLDNFRI